MRNWLKEKKKKTPAQAPIFCREGEAGREGWKHGVLQVGWLFSCVLRHLPQIKLGRPDALSCQTPLRRGRGRENLPSPSFSPTFMSKNSQCGGVWNTMMNTKKGHLDTLEKKKQGKNENFVGHMAMPSNLPPDASLGEGEQSHKFSVGA